MTVAFGKHPLALDAAEEVLEQACRIGIWRAAKDTARYRDQRRAFARVNNFDRLTLLLELQQDGIGAVDLHGALAEPKLLRRVAGRLNLHDPLAGELLEIRPAEFLRDCERRSQDRAAIGGMGLDEPAPPFGIEQVGEAPRRLLALDEVGVVTDDAERCAQVCERAVGIDGVRRKVPRRVFGNVRRKPAAALPGNEMRRVGA
jgi:hypothetical protein